ncbi:hypothetical protein [Bradyrhizobium sp. 930_D9_N1_4]|uniref:hypothetical protein n=1 Tax=Bradyrhizobium sp. 930_D9_N1_4 TaxID=3240374 RepID=UPI003F8A49F0
MTVAVAAFSPSKGKEIVTISDARLSYGEAIPAADDATMKNKKIAGKWAMMFAASDATAFDPVIDATIDTLQSLKHDEKTEYEDRNFDTAVVMDAARQAYEKEFSSRFFRDKLARFGFLDIAEFRRTGYEEMGKDLYHEYSMELARFDLGLELLIYGFDGHGRRSIFEVANPGKVINHSLRGYAAIGSGSLMALAALNKKPLGNSLADTIYRIFDAKFSSETARDVGQKTHVISLAKNGKNGFLTDDEVEDVHNIWLKELARPHPRAAISLIKKSDLVTAISQKRPRAKK